MVHHLSEKTKDAIRIGILTEAELKEAILHYRQLTALLRNHGELYFLVQRDAESKLENLEYMRKDRMENPERRGFHSSY